MSDLQGPTADYDAHLQQGRFVVQRCAACRRHIFTPRVLCPHCGDDRLGWVEPSGRGVVYAVTVVERSAEKGGPFNVVLVDLEEGVRLMSRIVDLPHGEVSIGMLVMAGVVPAGKGNQLVFRPIARD